MNAITQVQQALPSVKSPIRQFKDDIGTQKTQMLSLLKGTGVDYDKFERTIVNVVSTNPDLLNADRGSLVNSCLQCARLGLVPNGPEGHAYFVPFGGKVTMLPGYKGLRHLAMNTGKYKRIDSEIVCKNDKFVLRWHDCDTPFEFEQNIEDRGEPIGVIAAAWLKDGTCIPHFMTKEEIERNRDKFSASKNSPAWSKSPYAMWLKTGLRHLINKKLEITAEKCGEALSEVIEREEMIDVTGKPSPVAVAQIGTDATEEASDHAGTADAFIEQVGKLTKPHAIDRFVKDQGANLMQLQETDNEAYTRIMDAVTARKAELQEKAV